jgi:hypothetical protein
MADSAASFTSPTSRKRKSAGSSAPAAAAAAASSASAGGAGGAGAGGSAAAAGAAAASNFHGAPPLPCCGELSAGSDCCAWRGNASCYGVGNLTTPPLLHTPLLLRPGIELDEHTSSMTVEQYLQHFLAKMTEKAQVRV